ncbi:uncharacterized protein [Amphiura filiformis]|uniref:uncharacterized protein n=1 Tax=Amphiura filiformis TaxID=82378 RepID=UPI003B21B329
MNSASSQELKQPVLSTIEVTVPPATCAGTSSMLKTNQTVLFAIPAPRSMGNGMLCMCRKIFWTNDNLVHCAYIPVSKEEATQLLSGPSSINVLQNPGSQLLTVSSTGTIIGVQQTVGIIKTKPPVLVTQKIERETTPVDGIKMPCAVPHTASIPDQAVKLSSNSPTLRQSTTTPKKITPTATATCDIPMFPKISAVYSLAEHSARSASIGTTLVSSNKYAFAIAHPQETPVDIKSGNVIMETDARTLTEHVNDKTDPSVLKSLPNDEALQTNPKGHSSIVSVKKNTLSEQEKDLKKHNTEGTNRRSSNIMSKDSTNKGLGEAVPKPYSKNYVRESAKTPADVIPLDLTKKVLSNKRPAHNVTDNRTYNQTAQRAINKQSKITRTIQSVTVPLREETPLDLSNRVTSTLTSKTFRYHQVIEHIHQ